jgi:hypothetical protein
MRRLAVLLMLALIAAALSGCYDARELDDISRVIAIGIDRGVSDAWRVTVQVPTLQGGGESVRTAASATTPRFHRRAVFF